MSPRPAGVFTLLWCHVFRYCVAAGEAFPYEYNQIRDTVPYTVLFHGLGGEVCDVISGKAS